MAEQEGEMTAGFELDVLVAERVMGLEVRHVPYPGARRPELGYLPIAHYSTDIKAAWDVVNRLREKKWLVVIKVMPEGFPYWYADDDPRHFYARTVCSADYQPQKTPEECRRYINGHPMGVANSDALAICRCAVEVIEAEERYAV